MSATSRPLASPPPAGLRDVLDVDAFRKLAEGYAELDSIGITLFDAHGERVAQVGPTRLPLCELLSSKTVGSARCRSQLTELAATRPGPGQRATCECFTGYRYVIEPIEHEGAVIARLAFGPFLEREPREERRSSPPETVVELFGDASERESALRADGRARPVSQGKAERAIEGITRVLRGLVAGAYARGVASRIQSERARESYAELEAQNRRLEEMVARLSELDRMKSSFLATITHELRTPLTSVIGYSEMLIEGLAGPLTNDQAEYVRTILGKGEQLLGLINALLEFSKAEAGAMTLSRGNVELGGVVRGVLDAMRADVDKKGIEVRIAQGMPRAYADREKLRKALEHIIGNAVKFTPSGGHIEVSAEETAEGKVRLKVSDTGIGIPTEARGRIFDPFYQADSSSTREYGGAGIGLSIAKRFLEAQEGTVAVESAVGRGSTFYVSLPRAR